MKPGIEDLNRSRITFFRNRFGEVELESGALWRVFFKDHVEAFVGHGNVSGDLDGELGVVVAGVRTTFSEESSVDDAVTSGRSGSS